MSSTVECECKKCGKLFTARTADRARGWARFCSKSCKAQAQEKRTHQYRDFCALKKEREEDPDTFCNADQFDNTELGD